MFRRCSAWSGAVLVRWVSATQAREPSARFGAWNRPNQRGPEEMGWRTTAQNLNLNRDYAKADAPEMRALFIAHGPSFARGVVLPDMDSVVVQPLLGRLLGLNVPSGDGRAEDSDGFLRD
jgi:hypothetical protein